MKELMLRPEFDTTEKGLYFFALLNEGESVGTTYFMENWKGFSSLFILYLGAFSPFSGKAGEEKIADFLRKK